MSKHKKVPAMWACDDNNSRIGWLRAPLVATIATIVAACSGETIEQTNDVFPAAADVLNDPDVVADTAELNVVILDRAADGNLSASVFDTETELLIRAGGTPSAPVTRIESGRSVAGTDTSPVERKAWFGDLHVHTSLSFDGHSMGTLAGPGDAYRFARGESVRNPGGFDMQLSRPLDFYAVTDHAMYLGVFEAASDTTTEFSKTAFAQPYHDFNAPDKNGTDVISTIKRFLAFSTKGNGT